MVAPAAPHSPLVIGAAVAATVFVLYVGQSLLIPMALAGLLAFALEPLARRLRRLGLGRIGAAVVVVTLTLSVVAGFGYVVGTQVYRLAERIPSYKSSIEQKIRSARSAGSTQRVLDKASTALRELQEEIDQAPAEDQPRRAGGASRRREIVAVQVQEPEQSPLQFARELLRPIIAPVGMVGLVIVLLVIMLLEHADLRDRMIRLFGGRDLTLTTNAMSEAGERVSKYLLMQLLVNVTYGLPIGIGLYLIGVPNAPLWGLLAMVLRFIPYIGPLIAMVFPMTLALAVDPGWSMLLWTIGLFVVVELISNNIVEPWLYGSSTGISAVAIIVAAIFWTTLWGPAGLLLSTPLTVCLVVLGRYVPQLRFLDVLLGRTPALSESERFYQRMLADDVFEGLEVAIGTASGNEPGRPAHEVMLPALQLAEADRRRNALPRERAEAVGANTLQVLAQLRDLGDDVNVAAGDAPAAPVTWSAGAVLCVGRRSSLDAAAAQLLAQVLGQRGITARTPPGVALSNDVVEQMFADSPPELVVLVHLSECAVAQAQHACKRIKRHTDAPVLLAFFDAAADLNVPPAAASVHAQGTCAGIARSLDEAVAWVDERARAAIALPMVAAPDVPREQERIEALMASGLLDSEPEPRFDAITASLREAFDVPIALISLVDGQRQFWKSASDPQALCGARESPRSTSICGHVVSANEVMVVPDTLLDARFANNPFVRERGIRFYAGAPLRAANGLAIGTVCVLGKTPRQVSRSERHLLQVTARQVMQEIAEVGRSGRSAEPVVAELAG